MVTESLGVGRTSGSALKMADEDVGRGPGGPPHNRVFDPATLPATQPWDPDALRAGQGSSSPPVRRFPTQTLRRQASPDPQAAIRTPTNELPAPRRARTRALLAGRSRPPFH